MTFQYIINPESLVIIGEFRSGYDFERTKSLLFNVLNTNKIKLDLTRVVYMDSDTMNFVKKHPANLNIEFDKNSYVYKRYLDKFGEVL